MTLRPRYSATFNSALNTSSWAEVAPEMFIGGLQPINLLSTVQELVSGPTRCVVERKREGKREKGRGKYRKPHCVCLKLLERLVLVQSSLSLSFTVNVIFNVFFCGGLVENNLAQIILVLHFQFKPILFPPVFQIFNRIKCKLH